MTVKELIEELKNYNPDLVIATQVEGDMTRTGDFITIGPGALMVHKLRPLTYGGCDSEEYSDINRESDCWAGEPFQALVF